MADSHDIRSHAIKQKMHRQFGRKLAIARQLPAVQISHNQLLGSKHALVHAGGSGKDAAVVQPYGNVPFAGDDVPALVHPASGNADFAAVLLFAFHVA